MTSPRRCWQKFQEALEDEVVAQGLDTGDAEGVGHDAARSGAAAGSHRNAVAVGIIDEVPHHQEVVDETGLLNDPQFVEEAVDYPLLVLVFRLVGILDTVALAQPVLAQLDQVLLLGVAGRHLVFREVQGLAPDGIGVAALGNIHRVGQGLRVVAEQVQHLRARLHVELGGPIAQALGVAHGGAGLHAQHHLMGLRVLGFDVVHVIGHDERQPGFLCDFQQADVGDALFLQAVVLQLDEIVAFTEDVGVGAGQLQGAFQVAAQDAGGDLAVQAGGGADEPLAVFGQGFQVDARLVIEALQVSQRDQAGQVGIALGGLAQQELVVGLGAGLLLALAFQHGAVGHVGLAADDRPDARVLGFLVEIDDPVHDPVIGDGQGRHAQLLGLVDGLADAAAAVEQTVLGVEMQVDEWNVAGHGW